MPASLQPTGGSRTGRVMRMVGVSGILILPVPAPVFAQSVDRQAERIQEQLRERERERAETFREDQSRPPTGEAPVAIEPEAAQVGGECASIREVRIEGLTRFRRGDFAEALAPLAGPCVAVGAIDAALRAITNHYVAAGYVTSRAFVGPQDLKSGTLVITMFEGRVGGVEGEGDRPYGGGEIGAAFPGVAGGLLNLRALEQGVDQLARLGKAEPSIDIAPGATPGTSKVLVKRKEAGSWVRPSLSLNNQGSTSTGRWQATLGLDVDSPLGIADSWSLYYQNEVDGDGQRGSEAYGGFVSLPYGWWTLSLNAGASRYHSVLEGNGLSFATRGQSWNAGASLDRMIYRDAKTKLALIGGLAVQDTKNFIQGIALRTGSYRIASAKIGARWQRRAKATLWSASLGFEQGLGLFGAQTVDTGPGGAKGKFSLVAADVAAQTGFELGGMRFTNRAMLRAQWGLTNLFPAQRFSVGGFSTVRGFRDDGISGRSGASFREELGVSLVDLAARSPMRTNVSAFVGYDVGGILPHDFDAYERGLLQSLSAGVRAQGRHVQAELAVAVPVSAPSWVRHRGAEVMASVRMTL
ncbi:ShlB/FhaC/HecB family hemolysin secretion/activation protein [Sphingomonas cavernae]|nr:ShlB/FhaC/HecB family hemolysin secretion/activation protein [Sphingomonas cavernae]